jgi:hypothetical protein
LDLSTPDSVTDEERRVFQEFYRHHKGRTLAGHDFWMEHDPGALKRYRRYAIEMNAPSSRAFPQVAVLCWLHFYAVIGFEEGIEYQIRNAQVRGGAARATILSTLETAFLHSGPLGARYVASASTDILHNYDEPPPIPWPAGWVVEPAAFVAGLDYSRTGLTAAELTALRRWHIATCGEVPPYVDFLGRHRPEVLKAYRMRFEHAAGGALPKQMFALLLLQGQVTRGTAPGVREAARMARGLGVNRQLALDAVSRAMIYTGPASVSVVAEATGDLFDDWAD